MQKIFFFAMLSLSIGCFNASEHIHRPNQTMQAMASLETTSSSTTKSGFYDFSLPTLDGNTLAFETLKGKKVIVMNVASACGYTPQYADWQKFYEANKEKVVILGFPCNQFMGQESGTNEEIKAFCQKNYGVTFPVFEKVDVKGAKKSPVFAWLTDKTQNGWNEQEPTWNFCKYLINEKGELVEFFASGIKPDNPAFLTAFNQ